MNKQSLIILDGSEYKFGRHNYVYRLAGDGGWVRSGKTADDIFHEWRRLAMRGLHTYPRVSVLREAKLLADRTDKINLILNDGSWMTTLPESVAS